MPIRDWLHLNLTDGLGPILSRRLIAAAGSAANACAMSQSDLRAIEGIGAARGGKLFRAMQNAAGEAEIEMQRASAIGAAMISPDDADYPLLLRSISDPPNVLYVKGSLEARDLHGVAIVGSRKCSFYGREQAERFGALLGGSGVTVISGGARGIDSAAHRGALTHPSGRTIAVLGCGIDRVYPPENESLFEQIAERGAVVSEFGIGTPPMAENFPRRNRIVSGMARGVLVIEAAERSGALITARQAGDEHGRPVFALPGRVDNELSAGPHRLIRDGAILCSGLDDILPNLMPLPDSASEPIVTETTTTNPDSLPVMPVQPMPGLTDRQATLFEQIEADGVSVDQIVERSGLPASVVLQELTLMTLKGLVRRIEGGFTRAAFKNQ